MPDQRHPRFVYLLSRARHQLMREMDRQCQAEAGISATQLGALFALRELGACQLKDLSRVLGLDNSAVTGLSRRLVQAGVVEKRRSASDGRAFELQLTAQGREVTERGKQAMQVINARLAEGFTAAELQVAARFLDTVIARFSPPDESRKS